MEIETIGVFKNLLVPVRAAQSEDHHGSGLDYLPVHCDGFDDMPRDELGGGIVAQHFLNGRRQKAGVLPKLLHLLGMLDQAHETVSQKACRRLLTCVDKADDVGDQLILAQEEALVTRMDQGGEHVVARRFPDFLNVLEQSGAQSGD